MTRPFVPDVFDIYARLRGCLMGIAIGDALGYPSPHGLVFTQLTLCTVEGILRANQAAVIQWRAQNPFYPYSFIPNKTFQPGYILPFLFKTYQRWFVTSKDIIHAAPFGSIARSTHNAFVMARDCTVLDQPNLSAAYFAALIYGLLHGSSLTTAMAEADNLLAKEADSDKLRTILSLAKELAKNGPPNAKTIERLGKGWAGEEALAISLLCTLTANRREIASTLQRAASFGGAGAITGGLLGTRYGIEALPKRRCLQIELRNTIEKLARDLNRALFMGKSLDSKDYELAT